MTYKELIRSIEQQQYQPIYLLHGEENYFIDQVEKACLNILSEDEKVFNEHIFYGKDTDINDLITNCYQYPMGASHKVIIVREAQNLRNIEELKNYTKKPVPSTILVLTHKNKSVDKRKAFVKDIAKTGVVFESKLLYDNQVPSFLQGLVEEKGKKIDFKSSQIMMEFVGNNLTKLINEIDKLIITLPPNSNTITPEHIEKNIGYSKDYNVFELQKAIGKKDVLKVNRIINYFVGNPKHSLAEVIPILFRYFQNIFKLHYVKGLNKQSVSSTIGINPYFAEEYLHAVRMYNIRKTVQIIELLRDYDLKSKGVGYAGSNSDLLLKELMFKIMH